MKTYSLLFDRSLPVDAIPHAAGQCASWARCLNATALLPITQEMSIEATLQRISAIQVALSDPAKMIGGGGTAATGGTEAPEASTGSSFASALQQASGSNSTPMASTATGTLAEPQADSSLSTGSMAGYPTSLGAISGLNGVVGAGQISSGGGVGAQIVAIAESQLGQAEQPPGSNESPAIAQYRTATAGAAPGEPWCAYFASWVAAQAGQPLGAQGQGTGSVSELWSWAQSAGRAVVNGPGVTPKPGDLIVFGSEHVGIVRGVLPSGQIETIEGNYEDKVAANVRSPTEATGYVSMS